MPIHTVQQL